MLGSDEYTVFNYKPKEGTALRKKLYQKFSTGQLMFTDLTLDIVVRGSKVVVVMPDGSEHDYHVPDPLLDHHPEDIAVVHVEDGGAGTSGQITVHASVHDPETGEHCPASCFSYDSRI